MENDHDAGQETPLKQYLSKPSRAGLCLALIAGIVLTGCAAPTASTADDSIHDPFEARNRQTHAFNKRIAGTGTGGAASRIPEEVQHLVHNVADNLAMPQAAVNSLLQGDLTDTGIATFRFAVNSIAGIGGLIDVAGEFGLRDVETDFGETLYVWGVGEGAYLELPVIGPSTQRDTAGRVIDLFTNPLTYVLDSPERYVGPVASIADRVFKTSRRGDVIDDVLNNSADSYAQARLIYLQKRRYELSRATSSELEYDDPYAD